MPRIRTLVATLCVLPLLLIGLGCYETQYPLGSADKATVDPAYVGDYAATAISRPKIWRRVIQPLMPPRLFPI